MTETIVGIDIGATLAKIAIDDGAGRVRYALQPSEDWNAVATQVANCAPARVGLTGGGAARLAECLDGPCQRVNEFAAWGAGASLLLEEEPREDRERYLLVSLGTGTSVLLVDGMSATRVGGTALGGGTVVGLGNALLGTRNFEEICRLAEAGDRGGADLRVSDIYRPGEIPLRGDLTAASFGKLARAGAAIASREDLAAAVMGIVGENVALICASLAAAAQLSNIVYGGSTLRANPALTAILKTVTAQLGRRAKPLPKGEFAGALGSLELARPRNGPASA